MWFAFSTCEKEKRKRAHKSIHGVLCCHNGPCLSHAALRDLFPSLGPVFHNILHQSSPQFPSAPAWLTWEEEPVEAYLVPGFPTSLFGDCHRWYRASRSRIKVMDCHLHRCGVKWRPATLPPWDLLCLHLCWCQSYWMRRQTTRAREVLGIRPERKQNKNRNVCLVFKAHSSVCAYLSLLHLGAENNSLLDLDTLDIVTSNWEHSCLIK